MPYQAPGVRVKKTNGTVGTPTVANLKHGNLVNFGGVRGVAAKSTQVDRWTTPANAATIGGGEEFIVMVGGVVEMVLAAPNPVAATVGDNVNVSTAGVVTIGAYAQATTIGVVQEVDTTRTPNVARINTNVA
jgi:hypothetical protein